MIRSLKHIFTWWTDYTIGTWLHTVLHGEKVGEDDQGNIYYRAKNGAKNAVKTGAKTRERRWVIYNGTVEASRVPPEWHAWLHKTVDLPPTEAPPVVKAWEKPHQENLTGSPEAYAPKGSLDRGGVRAKATGDYEAWRP